MFDSALHHKIFEIAGIAGRGITHFKYVGQRPLHTILHGNMSYLFRVGDVGADTSNIKLRNVLAIRTSPAVQYDSSTSQYLGSSLASGGDTPFQLVQSEFTDEQVADVTDGNWVRKQIFVCRDVVFFPGKIYRFTFSSIWFDGTLTASDYGLRIESGGFLFSFDGSAFIKRAVTKLINTGP
jgi:hypothetical protein